MKRRNFLKLSVTTAAGAILPLSFADCEPGNIISEVGASIQIKISTSIGRMVYDMPYEIILRLISASECCLCHEYK